MTDINETNLDVTMRLYKIALYDYQLHVQFQVSPLHVGVATKPATYTSDFVFSVYSVTTLR